jgi:hypothetical protein
MSRKPEEQELERAAEAVGGLLMEAVQATIADRTPDPSRECVAEFLSIDDKVAPEDDGGPTELVATLTLVQWLSAARNELLDRPGRVEEALGWIEEAMGRRYRSRARYTCGALESADGARESMEYAAALQDDFLPSMIWVVAGVVAVHGEGDVTWLRRLAGPEQLLSGVAADLF